MIIINKINIKLFLNSFLILEINSKSKIKNILKIIINF